MADLILNAALAVSLVFIGRYGWHEFRLWMRDFNPDRPGFRSW